MEGLINKLIQQGYLKTSLIIEAFKTIKREDFVPENLKDEADINAPLPIGQGQTISQPLTVAFMLELLQPKPGDKILDIGSGSGWQTAMLAYIVSQHGNLKSQAPNPKQIPNSNNQNSKQAGRVYAIERIPELMEFGKNNVKKYNFLEKGIVEFICADASKGWPNIATCSELVEGFDKIIVAAAAKKILKPWKDQLKVGGRIVTPIENSIWLLIKKKPSSAAYSAEVASATKAGKATEGQAEFEEQEFPGFAFVPLIKD